MTTLNISVTCFLFTIITIVESARILAFFPAPSISHQVVFRPLTQELAKRGHDVTVITPDPAFPKGQTPANLTEIDVHDVSYGTWQTYFVTSVTGKQQDAVKQMTVIMDLSIIILEKQLQSEEVQKIVFGKDNHFDLLLLEACMPAALGVSHTFKVPVIQVSSFGAVFGNYETVGAPTHPFLYPSMASQRIYNLTMWEKLTELYTQFKIIRMALYGELKINEMLQRNFGPDVPTLDELSNNVDMLFMNIHPILEGNVPVPPSVIYTWGIHQRPEKDLPQDLKSYLDYSPNGVIYMSFGTNTDPSLFPLETIQMFIRVFSQLPYNILWKWNQDELPGRTKNIRISKWFPQSDLLRHPNIKLFITQGGLQSTEEAINAGVPLVGIPMFGDQWYNTEKYVHYKIGTKLNLASLTEDQFRNAIDSVIGDESYRKNIKKLSDLLKDQPQSALERAVWWTEHVLRHGGARHLRAPTANISWAHYLELELVLTLLLGLLLLFILVGSAVYVLCKFVSRTFRSKKIKVH